jgi:hypothetical protein
VDGCASHEGGACTSRKERAARDKSITVSIMALEPVADDSPGEFNVTLSSVRVSGTTVNYIVSGTAIEGVDYDLSGMRIAIGKLNDIMQVNHSLLFTLIDFKQLL